MPNNKKYVRDDPSTLANYAKDWIDDMLQNQWGGSAFTWTHDRADEFAAIDTETLLMDEYFLHGSKKVDGKQWLYPVFVDMIIEIIDRWEQGKIDLVNLIAGYGCLPGYAPVKTNEGYTSIEEIEVGDSVLGYKNETTEECKVVRKINSGTKEVFRIWTKDGNYIDATKDHVFKIKRQYWVSGKYRKEIEEWSVEKIINYLDSNKTNSKNVGLIRPKYISYTQEKELKIDPYLLGVLLGDGTLSEVNGELAHIRLSSYIEDIGVRERFNKKLDKYECELKKIKGDNHDYCVVGKGKNYGVTNKLLNLLREYGISSTNKFIPKEYLRASREDRIELLQGLIDSDGYSNGNNYEFCQKRKNLILDFKRLVEDLGGKASLSEKIVNGGVYYRCYAALNFNLDCALDRKNTTGKRQRDYRKHRLDYYESLGEMETYDITLDNESHCFLSYNDFITHNCGKTVVGSLLQWIMWYKFSTKYDPNSNNTSPQEHYGLRPDSMVAFLSLSKTLQKSKDITFNEVKNSFQTRFNNDYFPINPRVRSRLIIDRNNTLVFPNTATEAANAGYSVYAASIDEASFMEEIEDSAKTALGETYSQAKATFRSTYGRMRSRFNKPGKQNGMVIMFSSVNHEQDFLVDQARKAFMGKDTDENINIYSKILPPWEVRPDLIYERNKTQNYFYFDTKDLSLHTRGSEEFEVIDKDWEELTYEEKVFLPDEEDPNWLRLDQFKKQNKFKTMGKPHEN